MENADKSQDMGDSLFSIGDRLACTWGRKDPGIIKTTRFDPDDVHDFEATACRNRQDQKGWRPTPPPLEDPSS